MRRIYAIGTLGLVGAFAAAAQDPAQAIKMKLEAEKLMAQTSIVKVRSALIGQTVKNAPYSAVELTESNQMLADGTRIHNETRTTVYRDSEGRLRRETPNEVNIWDPVAKTSYVLNPQSMTAQKVSVGTFVFTTRTDTGATAGMRTPAPASADALRERNLVFERRAEAGSTASPEAGVVREKAELEYKTGVTIHISEATAGEFKEAPVMTSQMRAAGMMVSSHTMVYPAAAPTSESLGKQEIEGVPAEGTRTTSVIEAGTIGNDRAIRMTSERWFSPELQTVIMSKQSDPRTGEESFRLMNVNRAEPAAYLFQVPAAYQIVENK
jgi:hypothetical protein